MKLSLINNDQFIKKSHELWMYGDSSLDTIAEVIRSELSARSVCSQRTLVQSVHGFISSFTDTEIETVKGVLKTLELNGDISFGPRGMVAVTPLRAVQIGNGRYKLFGSLPSREVSQKIDMEIFKTGVFRSLECNNDDTFYTQVESLQGIVISPERWAGLDKTLPAGPVWLEGLRARMACDSLPASTLSFDTDTLWQMYQPLTEQSVDQRPMWKKASSDSSCSLWRMRNNYGRWIFAWTGGGDPESTSQIKISNDDALRTMFSLDECAGGSACVFARSAEEFVEMEAQCIFPRPEYRYLITMGERVDDETRGFLYKFTKRVWPRVKEILEKRLHITIDDDMLLNPVED